MAAKDTEPYLVACLTSIQKQTYKNWELIAVNDHSSDKTKDILEAFAQEDSRIRVFDSITPRLIPTLQTGYKASRGKLINRMDSDDIMPVDKLESLVSAWETHGQGTVIAGGTQHFVDQGEVGAGFRRYDQWLNEVARKGIHYQEIYKECVIPSHCWIIHKDDFDLVGAFDPLVYPEDYDLTFRFYKHGLKVVGIDKVLHFWRDRSNRISRTWEEYKDNRYFELKVNYFLELDYDPLRPLVLWGAGKNGKDLAKILLGKKLDFHWVCDTPGKIGKNIYNVVLHKTQKIRTLNAPQIIIAVSSPGARPEIEDNLKSWGKQPVDDYWFFC